MKRGFLIADDSSTQAMSDVTPILNAIGHGDPQAACQLLPLVYDELRKLAAHKKPSTRLSEARATLPSISVSARPIPPDWPA